MKSAGAEPGTPPCLARTVAGWTAVAVSTTSASVWAFWGGVENFHEGWYYRELWRNIALACVQYLPWMFVPMVAGLLALWHRWVGVAVHLALAGGVLWLFGLRSAGGEMLGLPVVALAVLYGSGSVSRVHWARRALVGIPLATLICAGAYPGYRAVTRLKGVDASTRRIRGNGVELVWAPAGPGWDDMGFSWFEAARRCGHLSADGKSIEAPETGVWRLPTVDEIVRSMSWRGQNAGGSWDPATRSASFRSTPDKEAPLWDPYSRVIYWWAADEADGDRAYRVVYNGQVHALPKKWGPGSMACRCVKAAAP
jgi:hypothetical protein